MARDRQSNERVSTGILYASDGVSTPQIGLQEGMLRRRTGNKGKSLGCLYVHIVLGLRKEIMIKIFTPSQSSNGLEVQQSYCCAGYPTKSALYLNHSLLLKGH